MYFPKSGSSGQNYGLNQNLLEEISPSALSFQQGALSIPDYSIDESGSVVTPDLSGVTPNNVGGGGLFSGMNGMDKGRLALGGLQTLGSLYMAFQANKLAKKQFQFQKEFSNQNLANSIQSYNTALEDRIRSRAHTEGRDTGYADAYLSKNKLEDKRVG